MALSRVKVWSAGEILYASDLNSEFNNILNNGLSLISPLTTSLNAGGFKLTNYGGTDAPTSVTDAALNAFVQSGTGASTRTLQERMRDAINVCDFFSTAQIADVRAGTALVSTTTAIAAAITAVPTGGALRFPYGTYLGVISVRRSDITLIFENATIKHPAGAASNVLELGDTASGNGAAAYEKINIVGQVLLDGNKSNVTAPSDDLTGWGFCATKISNSQWAHVRAKNCHNGGAGIFIDSNYNTGSFYVESCGNVTHTGPGFDINSSKYGEFHFVSKDCYDGGRVLDNCWNLNVSGTVHNATRHGFVYNNQSTNESYNNNIDIDVYTCGSVGFNVGLNCRTSNIRANIYDATGVGMTFTNDATYHSSNLNIDLTTRSGDLQGLLLYGDDCIIRHQSYLDGRAGSQGAVFAVDVNGNRNKLSVSLVDSSTWQVRGVVFRAGATDNELLSYTYTNTADPLNDGGTRTKIEAHGTGAAVASGNSITLPFQGLVIPITGSTGIATISASRKGLYVLTFENTLTVVDGSNLKLAGNFSATADDTLTIYHDGTNAYEVARSNN